LKNRDRRWGKEIERGDAHPLELYVDANARVARVEIKEEEE